MIDWEDPNKALSELRAGRRYIEEHLRHYHDQVCYRHGHAYRSSDNSAHREEGHENFYHQWLAYVVPLLAWGDPEFEFGTHRMGSFEDDVEALQWGMHSLAIHRKLGQIFADGPAVDMQFNFGVCLVSLEELAFMRPAQYGELADAEEGDESRRMPSVYRIDQRSYVEDPTAMERGAVRWQGHHWVRDKDDLLREAEEFPDRGWDKAAIEAACESGTPLHPWDHQDNRRLSGLERDYVQGYSVWSAEAGSDPEEGLNGAVYTYAASDVSTGSEGDIGEPLRAPYDYYGPPCGPYHVFGVYKVPGSAIPLGPLTAIELQIRELNEQSRAAAKTAKRYKRGVAILNGTPDLAQKISAFDHDTVWQATVPEGTQVIPVEAAGVTEQMLSHLGISKERLERLAGFSEAQQGLVTGRGTARENVIAAAASNVRIEWIKKKFREGVEGVGRKLAWYCWHEKDVAIPFTPETLELMGAGPRQVYMGGEPQFDDLGRPLLVRMKGEFRGGNEDSEVRFEDLFLRLRVHSMDRASEAEERDKANQVAQFVATFAPAIPQMPWVEWKEFFRYIGDAWNMPEVASLFDVDMAMQMAGAPPQMDPTANRPSLVPRPSGGSKPTGAPPMFLGQQGMRQAPAPSGAGTPMSVGSKNGSQPTT